MALLFIKGKMDNFFFECVNNIFCVCIPMGAQQFDRWTKGTIFMKPPVGTVGDYGKVDSSPRVYLLQNLYFIVSSIEEDARFTVYLSIFYRSYI